MSHSSTFQTVRFTPHWFVKNGKLLAYRKDILQNYIPNCAVHTTLVRKKWKVVGIPEGYITELYSKL
jgi:hypothetical protein